MRSLDTNVLARYFTEDDPRQVAAVDRIFQESKASGEPLLITIVVLCELIWVLSTSYAEPKERIAATVERILQTGHFRIQNDDLVRRSLQQFRKGSADFSDYVIGEVSREAGCRDTVTFDRGLRNTPGFTVIG